VGLAVRLLDEFERPDASSPLIIEGLTLELLGFYARCARCAREARGGPAAPRWLLRVRDLLIENCISNFTMANLAAEAGVHPNYLAGVFRRYFGCTVGDYVRGQRVSLACRHLANTDAPLASVALMTGFADQSHFTRAFKRQVGLTPAAYRKAAARATGRSKS
jgi:AraC family transcriptional regulator